MMTTNHAHKIISSPVGRLKLVAGVSGLAAVLWEKEIPLRVRLDAGAEESEHPVLLEAEQQLQEYFQGTRETFSLPLEFHGTDFQKKVWQALLEIPHGEVRSYGDLARGLGQPKAVRAVGGAIGKNPIAIVVACHRVIGSNGTLTGFAGGLPIKQFLLNLESSQNGKESGLKAA